MRSDKVLFLKSQPNSSTYDTVKTYTVMTAIRTYISTRCCIRLTAYKTEVSLEENAPICTCHLDHCSCWILDTILWIQSQEHFRSQEETCYSPQIDLHPGKQQRLPVLVFQFQIKYQSVRPLINAMKQPPHVYKKAIISSFVVIIFKQKYYE